jgi:hypothetical protein
MEQDVPPKLYTTKHHIPEDGNVKRRQAAEIVTRACQSEILVGSDILITKPKADVDSRQENEIYTIGYR